MVHVIHTQAVDFNGFYIFCLLPLFVLIYTESEARQREGGGSYKIYVVAKQQMLINVPNRERQIANS